MNQTQQNPTLYHKIVDTNVDYSEIYRIEETFQLNKRLRKTRNILLISAAAFLGGACVFWVMPETSFATKNFLTYLAVTLVMTLLSIYSSKHPYYSLVTGLSICIGLWAMEIFFETNDDLLIEGSIQKLFIISLMVWCFHSSREAELIRRELLFS
jgi:hypothetical protein